MPKNKLTPRQARFVQEYCVDLNATQAAIRAGYSERRASEIGWQQLQKTTVKEAIAKEQAKRAERVEITQDFVLRELMANLKFGRSLDNPGAVNRTLELLGKHLDMFKDRVEHSGTIGIEQALMDIDGRTAGLSEDQEQADRPPLAH